MSRRSSERAEAAAPVPAIVVLLELEAASVVLDIVGCDSPAIAERLGAWIGLDAARRSLLASALSLLPRREGDLADDEAFALVSAAFGSTVNPPPDPLDAVVPMFSLQGKTLRRALALGESGRRWIAWAAVQPWPLDPEFRAALLEVAGREGLLEASDASAEDGNGG